MVISHILPLALLIVLWWIGIWGLVETIIHIYIRGSTLRALCVYVSMIVLVLFVVHMNTKIVDYFV